MIPGFAYRLASSAALVSALVGCPASAGPLNAPAFEAVERERTLEAVEPAKTCEVPLEGASPPTHGCLAITSGRIVDTSEPETF